VNLSAQNRHLIQSKIFELREVYSKVKSFVLIENYMDFIQEIEPELEKPIIIAAMQDMGNVGSIVINFVNRNLKTKTFKGGFIDLPEEKWEYRYTEDLIVFGGGSGQPQTSEELHALCQDVIDITKKYSTKFIYTLGGFHTNRIIGKSPKTFVTTTSQILTGQIEKLGVEITPSPKINNFWF